MSTCASLKAAYLVLKSRRSIFADDDDDEDLGCNLREILRASHALFREEFVSSRGINELKLILQIGLEKVRGKMLNSC